MTQEQKQFIIKALHSGIPAIADPHIKAIEEVARVAGTKREELGGQEDWICLNQTCHENIINTLRGSLPFMANEYIGAYVEAVKDGQAKFAENIAIRTQAEHANQKDAKGTQKATKDAATA